MTGRWRMDLPIALAVLVLMTLGADMIYSASVVKAESEYGDGFYFFKRQAAFGVVGLLAMLAGYRIPYGFWRRAVAPLLLLALALLVAVLTPLGHSANSASRWIPIGPVNLQAAEFAKLALVLYLAHYFARRQDEGRVTTAESIRPLVVVVLMVVLVAAEPDLGTALFLALLAAAVLVAAGAPLRPLFGFSLLVLPLGIFYVLTSPWRIKRIQAFLDPFKEYGAAGFQLVQSFLALGEGGFKGSGLGAGRSKLHFLPEPHTDFILAVVGEELGFVGVFAILALFALYVHQGTRAALGAPDSFGRLLAAGITFMVGLQALVNSMVVLGLLPTKGLPLPFVSYGGSSLVVSLAATGILLNVAAKGRAA